MFPLHCDHTHSKEVTVDEDLGKINLLNVQPLLEVHTVIPRHEDISLVNPAHNTQHTTLTRAREMETGVDLTDKFLSIFLTMEHLALVALTMPRELTYITHCPYSSLCRCWSCNFID